ncbi:MAG: helix-turn-helix transcriptional regulator [Gemmatimonadaceae bacterium]
MQDFLLSAAARRVLAPLRYGPMTVDELAKVARLTPNAVRNQLVKLRQANLVVQSGTRPSASKPSGVYSITIEGEAQFSTIYLPVLTQFLRVAEGQCSGTQLTTFMTDTGKSLAKRYPKPTGDVKSRVSSGARLLRSFGGIPEVRASNGTLVIRSAGCPLAALTSENAAACRVLEGLLTEYVGARARTCCIREPDPRCCFEIRK